jgi:hypothetical protein
MGVEKMTGTYATTLSKLTYSVSNKSESAKQNKKLSESRLGMCAIKTLSTEIEVEINQQEFEQGRSCRFEINDHYSCEGCAKQKPINRLQCQLCKGLGYIQGKRTEDVLLPAGLVSGQRVVYKGLGRHDSRTGAANDLVIIVKVATN